MDYPGGPLYLTISTIDRRLRRHLKFTVQLSDGATSAKAEAMLDSGASSVFVNADYAARHGLRMRPVERPQDREWTEWVYLLKRLATKRRIPARVLYNGQIKQFVTILENSLEMRHAAKHQSRPLKDDRNILQLISAGIQVAKILKDAPAMEYLDRLYVSTEKQIQERAAAAAARFRT